MSKIPISKRISMGNLPVYYPINSTVISLLVLDRLQAPGWLWGAVITFWIVAFGSVWLVKRNSVVVDVFAGTEEK
jgi:hypothetical protein